MARNVTLARNLVCVLRRSIRGKAKQLEKGVLLKEVSDYCTVILKQKKILQPETWDAFPINC